MKSMAVLMTALALATATVARPSLAAEEGAKGMYFKQLSAPSKDMNVGVQYWIELQKGGKSLRANNKTQFHSGDAVVLHVKPNINGYAYIVLRGKTAADNKVLFPLPEYSDDNTVRRGEEITLPGDGTLAFDSDAGEEKLCLILSRKPIDPTAVLAQPADEQPAKIAMADTGKSVFPDSVSVARVGMLDSGSKDLIPNRVFVAYNDLPAKSAEALQAGKTIKDDPTTTKPIAHVEHSTKSTTSKKSVTKPVAKVATRPAASATSSAQITQPTHSAPTTSVHKATQVAHARPNFSRASINDPAVVTVVYNDPTGIMATDISLHHVQ